VALNGSAQLPAVSGVNLTNLNGANLTAASVPLAALASSSVDSAKIVDGSILNADINSAAGIAYSKLALAGGIVNADISAAAAIADTKLATIGTAGKVANSATTGASTNTPSALVLRDASGNFAAGTITASLVGNATIATNFTGSLVGDVTGTQGATTVATVGGITAANVASGVNAANTLTGVNLGTGSAVFNSRSGTSLNFRTLVAGSGIGITSTANEITITGNPGNSSNVPLSLVARDASGNFAAGTITASTFSGSFSGSGAGLTGLNGAQLAAGSVTGTQLASGLVLTGANLQATTAVAAGSVSNTTDSPAALSFATIYRNWWVGQNRAPDANIADNFFIYDQSANATRLRIDTLGVIHGNGSGLTNVNAATASTATNVSGIVALANGGTGANNAAAARTALGAASLGANSFTGIQSLTDNDLYLRASSNTFNGVGWYGTGKSWGILAVDGPVVYGNAGGILATWNGTSRVNALVWNSAGNIGIGFPVPSFKVDVNGVVAANGGFNNSSDVRLKKNIETIGGAMEKVAALRGVRFDWRRGEFPDREMDADSHLGFIAQEVQAVLPEVVKPDGHGFYSMAYMEVVPVLVEAMKEQQAELKTQCDRNTALEARIAALEKLLTRPATANSK
jgi:hypothetical protein